MILVIDNYDSFTYNLVHYLQELGADTEVVRNDALTAEAAVARKPAAVLISPGPCTPNEAGISLALIPLLAEARIPLLGVCLGHQALAQHFGGKVVRAPKVMHGKTSPVMHDGTGIFADVPSPFTATRYHSLIVETAPVPLIANAHSDDGIIQGLRHPDLPMHGVQFHPESIATENGHDLLRTFLTIAGLSE